MAFNGASEWIVGHSTTGRRVDYPRVVGMCRGMGNAPGSMSGRISKRLAVIADLPSFEALNFRLAREPTTVLNRRFPKR